MRPTRRMLKVPVRIGSCDVLCFETWLTSFEQDEEQSGMWYHTPNNTSIYPKDHCRNSGGQLGRGEG